MDTQALRMVVLGCDLLTTTALSPILRDTFIDPHGLTVRVQWTVGVADMHSEAAMVSMLRGAAGVIYAFDGTKLTSVSALKLMSMPVKDAMPHLPNLTIGILRNASERQARVEAAARVYCGQVVEGPFTLLNISDAGECGRVFGSFCWTALSNRDFPQIFARAVKDADEDLVEPNNFHQYRIHDIFKIEESDIGDGYGIGSFLGKDFFFPWEHAIPLNLDPARQHERNPKRKKRRHSRGPSRVVSVKEIMVGGWSKWQSKYNLQIGYLIQITPERGSSWAVRKSFLDVVNLRQQLYDALLPVRSSPSLLAPTFRGQATSVASEQPHASAAFSPVPSSAASASPIAPASSGSADNASTATGSSPDALFGAKSTPFSYHVFEERRRLIVRWFGYLAKMKEHSAIYRNIYFQHFIQSDLYNDEDIQDTLAAAPPQPPSQAVTLAQITAAGSALFPQASLSSSTQQGPLNHAQNLFGVDFPSYNYNSRSQPQPPPALSNFKAGGALSGSKPASLQLIGAPSSIEFRGDDRSGAGTGAGSGTGVESLTIPYPGGSSSRRRPLRAFRGVPQQGRPRAMAPQAPNYIPHPALPSASTPGFSPLDQDQMQYKLQNVSLIGRARFDYLGRDDEHDLSFRAGDLVEIFAQDNFQWGYGRRRVNERHLHALLDDQRMTQVSPRIFIGFGGFPISYVEILADDVILPSQPDEPDSLNVRTAVEGRTGFKVLRVMRHGPAVNPSRVQTDKDNALNCLIKYRCCLVDGVELGSSAFEEEDVWEARLVDEPMWFPLSSLTELGLRQRDDGHDLIRAVRGIGECIKQFMHVGQRVGVMIHADSAFGSKTSISHAGVLIEPNSTLLVDLELVALSSEMAPWNNKWRELTEQSMWQPASPTSSNTTTLAHSSWLDQSTHRVASDLSQVNLNTLLADDLPSPGLATLASLHSAETLMDRAVEDDGVDAESRLQAEALLASALGRHPTAISDNVDTSFFKLVPKFPVAIEDTARPVLPASVPSPTLTPGASGYEPPPFSPNDLIAFSRSANAAPFAAALASMSHHTHASPPATVAIPAVLPLTESSGASQSGVNSQDNPPSVPLSAPDTTVTVLPRNLMQLLAAKASSPEKPVSTTYVLPEIKTASTPYTQEDLDVESDAVFKEAFAAREAYYAFLRQLPEPTEDLMRPSVTTTTKQLAPAQPDAITQSLALQHVQQQQSLALQHAQQMEALALAQAQQTQVRAVAFAQAAKQSSPPSDNSSRHSSPLRAPVSTSPTTSLAAPTPASPSHVKLTPNTQFGATWNIEHQNAYSLDKPAVTTAPAPAVPKAADDIFAEHTRAVREQVVAPIYAAQKMALASFQAFSAGSPSPPPLATSATSANHTTPRLAGSLSETFAPSSAGNGLSFTSFVSSSTEKPLRLHHSLTATGSGITASGNSQLHSTSNSTASHDSLSKTTTPSQVEQLQLQIQALQLRIQQVQAGQVLSSQELATLASAPFPPLSSTTMQHSAPSPLSKTQSSTGSLSGSFGRGVPSAATSSLLTNAIIQPVVPVLKPPVSIVPSAVLLSAPTAAGPPVAISSVASASALTSSTSTLSLHSNSSSASSPSNGEFSGIPISTMSNGVPEASVVRKKGKGKKKKKPNGLAMTGSDSGSGLVTVGSDPPRMDVKRPETPPRSLGLGSAMPSTGTTKGCSVSVCGCTGYQSKSKTTVCTVCFHSQELHSKKF